MGHCRWDHAAGLLAQECLISWPCTGELFTKDAFIRINRSYPGVWEISVESCMPEIDGAVSVVCAQSPDTGEAHYAVSFFKIAGNLITEVTEYWSQVEKPPAWRSED